MLKKSLVIVSEQKCLQIDRCMDRETNIIPIGHLPSCRALIKALHKMTINHTWLLNKHITHFIKLQKCKQNMYHFFIATIAKFLGDI